MDKETKLKWKYNIGFFLGLALALLGAFVFVSVIVTIFGLVMMILVRFWEMDKNDEDK